MSDTTTRGVSRRGFGLLAGAGAAAALTRGDAQATVALTRADAQAAPTPAPARRRAYLGTYTTQPGGGTGIGLAAYRPRSGELASTGVLPGVSNPSFLALSPDRRTLYAVDERARGAVTAVRVGQAGPPEVLGESRGTGGADPCHLSVHPGGRFLLTANYTGGSVCVHPIGRGGVLGEASDVVQHTGSGPDPARQEGPHAHMVVSDPGGRYVLAVDLGTDSVHTYRLDPRTGRLHERARAAMKPGAGPRHLAFHPSGSYAYVVNELDSTIAVCAYDRRAGTLTPGAPLPTLPPGTEPTERNYPAAVVISPGGRFLYVSNRGHNSIATFVVECGGAAVRLVSVTPSGGSYPRHIVLDPSGTLLFAANQKSGTVTVFRPDRATGRPDPVGAAFAAPIPVCVLPV
ncbi:lactonase family protein [Streptomyces sp. ISL-98]|uniref:lactonase family protein n=1 Tax=Streptomyces sp. ISL-98 TaxID=2819192 RepID=UPI001BE64D1B|nr:lactonase family protein [Streptomyces sp. ISL-98]MBT2508170.1 lactonase family protein [Streptomyces sp. ISL-98]